MKFFLLLAICLITPIHAQLKSVPPEVLDQKDSNQHAINVNFNMGNTQEVPTVNTATASPIQQLHFEHIHKSEPFPQESIFTRLKNGFFSGVATAAGSALTYKAIEIIIKIIAG